MVGRNGQGPMRAGLPLPVKDGNAKTPHWNNILKSLIMLSVPALEKFGKDERNVSALTLTLPPTGLKKAGEEIAALRKKLLVLSAKDRDRNRVTLYPVSYLPSDSAADQKPKYTVLTDAQGRQWNTVIQSMPIVPRTRFSFLAHRDRMWVINGGIQSDGSILPITAVHSSPDGVVWTVEYPDSRFRGTCQPRRGRVRRENIPRRRRIDGPETLLRFRP